MTTITLSLEVDPSLAGEITAAILKLMARTEAVSAAPTVPPRPAAPTATIGQSGWTEAQLTAWFRKLYPLQRAIVLTIAESALTPDGEATQEQLLAVGGPGFSVPRLRASLAWLEKFANGVRGTSTRRGKTAWPARYTDKGLRMEKAVAEVLLRIAKTV